MELEEIKNRWSEIDLSKERLHVNDNKIKEMLKNEGKSALARLIKTTKVAMIVPIPAGLLMCLLSYSQFFEAERYYMILPLIFLLICIFLVPLNIYRYRLLKKIDYSIMSVKEVSKIIFKYQNIIQKRKMYGITGFFIYMGIWIYLSYKLTFGSEIHWWAIIYAVGLCLGVGLFLIPFLHKKLHVNNINRIKKNLEELKEFEE